MSQRRTRRRPPIPKRLITFSFSGLSSSDNPVCSGQRLCRIEIPHISFEIAGHCAKTRGYQKGSLKFPHHVSPAFGTPVETDFGVKTKGGGCAMIGPLS